MLRLCVLLLLVATSAAADLRGREFISLQAVRTGPDSVYLSEPIQPGIDWDELVVSWNFRNRNEGIAVEVQISYPDRKTQWYCLGKWCWSTNQPRESVRGQRDEDGRVETDTLKMKRSGGTVQVRVRSTQPKLEIDYLGLSFANSTLELKPLAPNTNAWGKAVEVEERSQADYPEGINEWCSPTATSMLLSFWSRKLGRPELNFAVPEVARQVNDPNWPGTGNWPFNMAFAGAHQGIRAYVTRFSDVSEMERWIEAGIPLAFSVSYGWLQGKAERGNGHLVVCIGFTESGDVIVNDPGRRQVRQVYKRTDLIKAWAESVNTVYLVYPENHMIPTSSGAW